MPYSRDIVVIASSVGGPEALSTLLGSLPKSLPAAILIVQHLSPDSPMRLARMLSKATSLPVEFGKEGETILPGKVFLAPPDFHMVVRGTGLIGLDFEPKVRHSRPAADPLFESAAKHYGSRVIGIVLTGDDGDGSDGLNAVLKAGGIGIVQEPSEARSPSMPVHAITRGLAQYIVPLREMGPLVTLLTNATFPSAQH
jgi:two-component system chemotaxis response regulator CheB